MRVLPSRALRDALAAAYGADYTCPITTGIFLRMMAESVDSECDDVPWWRVVRDDGALFDKHPSGVEEHERLLRRDGVRFVDARRPLRNLRAARTASAGPASSPGSYGWPAFKLSDIFRDGLPGPHHHRTFEARR